MIKIECRKSLMISCVAVMGAIHALLVSIPGIWRSWMIVIEPLEGVILGPYAGSLVALIGSILGRIIRPRRGLFPRNSRTYRSFNHWSND